MTKEMTALNVRLSSDEKEKIKENAGVAGKSVSSYVRDILLDFDSEDVSQKETQNNTNVLLEKDERIADLKKQLDDYKTQIEQLHSIILVTQKDNQLLIEQTKKSWWKFWK